MQVGREEDAAGEAARLPAGEPKRRNGRAGLEGERGRAGRPAGLVGGGRPRPHRHHPHLAWQTKRDHREDERAELPELAGLEVQWTATGQRLEPERVLAGVRGRAGLETQLAGLDAATLQLFRQDPPGPQLLRPDGSGSQLLC